MSKTIQINGFTNAPLNWKSWLDIVDVQHATPLQHQVLDSSHPQAKQQDYYRLLVHQPELLQQRSDAYNAIMYAPKGLARADRELGAMVVSVLNGCPYCVSVHAQRFEQHSKRTDTIEQVFAEPRTAGVDAREQAISAFATKLTEQPQQLTARDIQALVDVGLDQAEILDLLNSVAIFAWANRLMLNLGEPEPLKA